MTKTANPRILRTAVQAVLGNRGIAYKELVGESNILTVTAIDWNPTLNIRLSRILTGLLNTKVFVTDERVGSDSVLTICYSEEA